MRPARVQTGDLIPPGLRWLPRLGELLMALLVVFSGVLHYHYAKGVANIVPSWMPWRLFWACFTGTAFLAAGISIVTRKKTRLAATLLGIMLCLFVLLIHAPNMVLSILHKPQDASVLWSFNGTGGLNNALKDVALALSALMLSMAYVKDRRESSRRGAAILGALFAVVMALFGVEHFFYTGYTPGIPSWSLVSFWIPGRLFWGYFTGAFLLCAGVMILIRKKATTAAWALGIMILAVAILTYAFRMAGHAANLGELINTAKDVAAAGGAFILAGILDRESLLWSGEAVQQADEQVVASR